MDDLDDILSGLDFKITSGLEVFGDEINLPVSLYTPEDHCHSQVSAIGHQGLFILIKETRLRVNETIFPTSRETPSDPLSNCHI